MQLWFASPEVLCDGAADRFCRSILTPDELAQAARFRQPQHQRQHVLTRFMVRRLLAPLAGARPERLVFATNRHGKPHVCDPPDFRWSFNISHTRGMIVCALAPYGLVGVDIEPLDRIASVDLADRYFSEFETAALRARPTSEQCREFLRYWTLKEAFIKAIGTGLATPLDDFGFDLSAQPQPRLAFVRGDLPAPDQWSFAQFELQGYLVAVAWHTGAEQSLSIDCRPFEIGLNRPLDQRTAGLFES